MTFETSIDKMNMRIHAVYVLGRSDLGLCISLTECSVNTALQNGGDSNQSHLKSVHFTFEERDFYVSVVAQTRTNMR